ncbi:type VI secretion system-associated protein TagF [Brytella acorum]|uniref:Type VI secretion system-associated protein TagF n=1 Tax=Brytella acorum TaxID=2959299 RepID=A0AA35UXN3_9PROT|nr:type VI secretion system-associated protein TagF [Brytella acorum]CAI9121505.1 type VI secretion system-associated protein TagF [Brytella acorum]
MIEPYAGYWGKLPAHGDFLRAGLPEGAVSRLDRWISVQLAESRARHGDAFETLWHKAPTWYFTIRPGVLEEGHAATGIWTPSIDAAGRCFPFVFVILHDPASPFYRGLVPFENAIRTAVEQTQSVQALEEAIGVAGCVPIPSAAPVHDVWWCVGNAAWGTIHGALPVDDAFDWLIEGKSLGAGETMAQASDDGSPAGEVPPDAWSGEAGQ